MFLSQGEVPKAVVRRLARRGLVMEPGSEWQKHGPDSSQPAYVGQVRGPDGPPEGEPFYVVVNRLGVFSIAAPDEWDKFESGNKVTISAAALKGKGDSHLARYLRQLAGLKSKAEPKD